MKLNELGKLKKLLEDSKSYREFLYPDTAWKQYEQYWFNVFPTENVDILTVPILVSDAQRQIASLVGGDPRIQITTDYPDQVAAANVLTAKLNQWFKSAKVMEEIRDAAQDAITLGTGFLLDGFGSMYGTGKDTVITGYDSTRMGEKNQRLEYHDNVQEDQPWSLRVHPTDIYVPPGTANLYGSYGFFHTYWRHIDEVRQDEKYMVKHRNAIQPDSAVDMDVTGRQYTSHSDYIKLVDWYDLRNNRRVTFNPGYTYALADDVDEMLIRLDRLPLHQLIFNKNSRYFWGTSDFDFQELLSQEINDIRTMQQAIRRTQVLKGFYDKEKLQADGDMTSEEEFNRKIMSSEVMAMIGVHGSPKDVVQFVSPSQQYDFMPQIELAKKEIEEFGLGIGPNQKGLMSSGRHTAYEAQMSESHYDQSIWPRRDSITKIIIAIVENAARLIFDFQTQPELIQARDAAGNLVTVQYTGADLRGDYKFTISLDSMRNKGQEQRVSEANMVLTQLAPAVTAGVVNPVALVRQYLSRLNSDWDIEALLQGPPQQGAPPQPFGQFQQGFKGPPPAPAPSLGALIGQMGQPQGQGT